MALHCFALHTHQYCMLWLPVLSIWFCRLEIGKCNRAYLMRISPFICSLWVIAIKWLNDNRHWRYSRLVNLYIMNLNSRRHFNFSNQLMVIFNILPGCLRVFFQYIPTHNWMRCHVFFIASETKKIQTIYRKFYTVLYLYIAFHRSLCVHAIFDCSILFENKSHYFSIYSILFVIHFKSYLHFILILTLVIRLFDWNIKCEHIQKKNK